MPWGSMGAMGCPWVLWVPWGTHGCHGGPWVLWGACGCCGCHRVPWGPVGAMGCPRVLGGPWGPLGAVGCPWVLWGTHGCRVLSGLPPCWGGAQQVQPPPHPPAASPIRAGSAEQLTQMALIAPIISSPPLPAGLQHPWVPPVTAGGAGAGPAPPRPPGSSAGSGCGWSLGTRGHG